MVSAALPVLVSVTDCDPLVVFSVWLANVRLELERLTAGAGDPPLPPVPVNGTTCGLSGALVVKVSEPVRSPEALGVNVTQTSQPYPGDKDGFPQKSFSVKSPVTATLEILREAVPALVIFTSTVEPVAPTAAEAKLTLVGVRTTVEGPEEPEPVPLRLNECGLPAALSVIVTDAVRVPVAVGLKVTLIVQVPLFAATELPHVLVCA